MDLAEAGGLHVDDPVEATELRDDAEAERHGTVVEAQCAEHGAVHAVAAADAPVDDHAAGGAFGTSARDVEAGRHDNAELCEKQDVVTPRPKGTGDAAGDGGTKEGDELSWQGCANLVDNLRPYFAERATSRKQRKAKLNELRTALGVWQQAAKNSADSVATVTAFKRVRHLVEWSGAPVDFDTTAAPSSDIG